MKRLTIQRQINVLIIEGIYAFNTINDMIFNLKEYDPYNFGKEIKEGYIKNDSNLE
jgi:uridine kinase